MDGRSVSRWQALDGGEVLLQGEVLRDLKFGVAWMGGSGRGGGLGFLGLLSCDWVMGFYSNFLRWIYC